MRAPRNYLQLRGIVAAGVLVVLAASCLPEAKGPVPPKAKSSAQPGGNLTISISQPTSIDPVLAGDPSGALVARTICDPLIQVDPATGELKSAIAEQWHVLESGKNFFVKLRRGAKFHNGKELAAKDVAYSISRAARQETASPFADLLRPIPGFGRLHGDEGSGGATDLLGSPNLSAIKVTEKYSFEMDLDESNGDLIRLLTHPVTFPVPENSGESSSFQAKPICTGPYQVAEPYKPGDPAIKLKRFNGYYAKNASFTRGGRGYADRIEFRILPDRGAEYAEFRAGTLDVAHVPRDKVGEAKAMGDNVAQGPAPSLEFVGLPVKVPPFDKPEVRQALSRAIDRVQIADSVFSGTREPARGFFPASLGKIHRTAACGVNAPLNADVEGARGLMSKSGVDFSGKTFKFYFNDEEGNRALVEEVGRQWEAAVGLKIEPAPLVWDEFVSKGGRPPGFDGPFRLTWTAEYPSADRYMAPLFASSSIGSTALSFSNFSRFDSFDFDRDLERKGRRASSESGRRAEYQQLENMICKAMPAIPINFGKTTHLLKPTVDSAVPNSADRATGDTLVRELFIKS